MNEQRESDLFSELVARYLDRDLGDDEIQQMNEVLLSNPARRAEFVDLNLPNIPVSLEYRRG